ncbi:hypothetical protein LCGC14_0336410 [marine sediment metagenome]|uniref:Uncharacterized protein n=1 Tax=marine sediment metagenome TaxID=412755 RepID=A0A0F9W2A9_9ZZZZ
MAKIKGKGTVLKQDVAGLVAVAQIISLNMDGIESETYEADTLDNTSAGILYSQTGRSEGGSTSGELFWDPVLAGHQAMTDIIITPVETAWELSFADAATTLWSIPGAGLGLGLSFVLNDGVKASFEIKHSGLPGFTT